MGVTSPSSRKFRLVAAIGVLFVAILICWISFGLLDVLHAPLDSGWSLAPAIATLVVLGPGLGAVLASERAPLWELTAALLFCLFVAFSAYACMGVMIGTGGP